MNNDNDHPWPMLPLGSIASEMCLGKMLDKQKNRGTLQPYLRNVNVRWFSFDLTDMKEMRFEAGEEKRFQLQPSDLVICEGGEPGRAAVWQGQTANAKIQKALHRVRFRPEEYDPHFAMYYVYFGTITNRFAPHYTGTTIKHLTGAALSQVEFPVPSLPEQRRIVAKVEELFSDLDAGVAALERAKANLKRYRVAVLKAAVEGSLTEAWRAKNPKTEPASKLLERILTERRRRWESDQLAKFAAAGKEPPKNWKTKYAEPSWPDTTGLPLLPKGWCWVALGQVARFQNGRAFPSKEYASKGVRLLRPGNLFADGSVRWTEKNSRFMPARWAEQHPTYLVRENELVMNLTAQSLADEFLGRTCLTGRDECCLLNQRLARIEPLDGLNKQFTLYLLKSSIFRKFVNGLNTGSLIEHMFTSQLATCCLPMPPAEEQHQIAREIEQRLSIIEDNETLVAASVKRAVLVRQSILKQAFEGKLVPQDPRDEPAAVLLERIIAASNGAAAKGKATEVPSRRKALPRRVKT